MLPLKRACYLAVSNINMHETYSNTQLIITYIDINIIKKIKGHTCDKAENTKNAFSTFIF